MVRSSVVREGTQSGRKFTEHLNELVKSTGQDSLRPVCLGQANNRSAVTPFRCLAATPHEGDTRAEILPGLPSLDRGSREAEVGFELQAFRSVNSCSNHLVHLAPRSQANRFCLTRRCGSQRNR
ncbi:hypothetical protein T265_06822 [Opisthorchis viverrini]|uniref:Uncharacterized protein n=1 Tax=Opisthorchis viverrini TaxID=6198 RepID=A0A074ZJ49_OPIVI|nr:hypothetical protein T265_06822 [Opisthorchis viverrini]KER25792.1 hypothetical protein T265_06822 [Opisthorchis viverrini]